MILLIIDFIQTTHKMTWVSIVFTGYRKNISFNIFLVLNSSLLNRLKFCVFLNRKGVLNLIIEVFIRTHISIHIRLTWGKYAASTVFIFSVTIYFHSKNCFLYSSNSSNAKHLLSTWILFEPFEYQHANKQIK